MNSFERRMLEWAADPLVGRMAQALVTYRELVRRWERLQWQRSTGEIDGDKFAGECRTLDAILDNVVAFLMRHRANVERHRALSEAVECDLTESQANVCRLAVDALDQWQAAAAAEKLHGIDPSFHVPFESLLAWGEKLLKSVKPAGARPAPPSTRAESREQRERAAAAAAAFRYLQVTDALAVQLELPERGWDELRTQKEAIQAMCDHGQAHEARWAALRLATSFRQQIAAQPPLPKRRSPSRREFMKQADRLERELKARLMEAGTSGVAG